jgi:glycosyltransferase involved in cell wall biosynthesis
MRVTIATPLGPGGKGGMDRIADLIASRVSMIDGANVTVSYMTTKGGLSKIRGAFVYSRAIAQLLRQRSSIDVLHINVAAYGSVYRKALLARAAHALKIPYVVHVHSGRFGEFWERSSPAIAAMTAKMLCDSAHIVVLGRGFRDLIVRRLPDLAERVSVLPNATKTRSPKDRLTRADGVRQITFLGSIMPQKGVPELIEALSRLGGRRDWTATIAGHGMVEETRRQAAAGGIADRVALPGWVGPDEVDAILARTDIFVLPSHSEGLSVAVLEAFAAGAAVITTPVQAMAEVVEHGRNGLLVVPGDVDALQAALQQLLDDDSLRARLVAAGYADHAARYEINGYVDRMVAIWRQCVARPDAPADERQ